MHMSARQAQETIWSSQTEKGTKKKNMKMDYIDSQVMTNSALEEGKVIRAGKYRRKSIPEMRDSWKEAVAVLPNTRVSNFYLCL